MNAICPNNSKHKEFLTTIHVTQTVKVDENGMFLDVISTDDTVAGPNPDNTWTCVICLAEGKVQR